MNLLEQLMELKRNILFNKSPVYYIRVGCRNSQIGEVHRVRDREGVGSFPAL